MRSLELEELANLQFKIDTPSNSDVDAIILKALIDYTRSQVEPYTRMPFTIYAKNKNNKVTAGANGVIRVNYDCEIENAIVDEDYRNQGIGIRMFVELEKFARANNCKHMLLDTVFQAKWFNEKLGFEIIAIIKNGVLGRDLFIMQKKLSVG